MKKLLGFLLFIGFIAVLYFFMSGYFSIKKGEDGSVIFKINETPTTDASKNSADSRDVATVIEDKLSISLPETAKDEIRNAVDELSSMGFSKDVIIDEASRLYDEYGKDAVNHVSEAFENMAKQAAKDTAYNILDDIKNTVLDAVDSLME